MLAHFPIEFGHKFFSSKKIIYQTFQKYEKNFIVGDLCALLRTQKTT
jgi:hypothetical protein